MNQFAAAFGGIQDARKEQTQAPISDKPLTVTRNATQKPSVKAKAVSPIAKSRNPAYEPVKLFMHAEKRRKAERKWEDEGGRDLSSLIESLMTKYLGS